VVRRPGSRPDRAQCEWTHGQSFPQISPPDRCLEVEKETRIDRVIMHLESVYFAIAVTQDRMNELNDKLGRAVARLVQLKPDYELKDALIGAQEDLTTVELEAALGRAQEALAKLEASEDPDGGAAPATDV
jgi:hypothetical protein